MIMISYLHGIVAEVAEKRVVLDVGGVGFGIYVSDRDVQQMPPVGEKALIYTHMSVREDDISLFGFLRKDELEIYRMLINVSGIGPKGGLSILSVLSADEIRLAVLSDDPKTISRAPGIGNKTAQKLILELKDKMKLSDVLDHFSEDDEKAAGIASALKDTENQLRSEAVQALTALGYSASEALRAVRSVTLTQEMTVETLLKEALRKMI